MSIQTADIITQVQKPDKQESDNMVKTTTPSPRPGLMERLMCCFAPRLYYSDELGMPIGSQNALLPPNNNTKKICLVLDLDETLVHSSFQKIPNPDFEVTIEIEQQHYNVYVKKRPFVDDFIAEMGKHFEVVVFTASVPKYADPVIDILDPNHIIQHRLYRQNCTLSGGCFVKDLSRLGRSLPKTVIIDNSAPAFKLHPNYAILIDSYFDDPSDTELRKLTPFLVKLSAMEDVRPMLRQWRTGERNFASL